MTSATGVGSWPGTDIAKTLRVVRGLLADAGRDGDGTRGWAAGPGDSGVTGLPYLPELPQRGPGADLVGRGAGLLVELPVDLQPAGWRLVDRPGRDAGRTAALWREDLAELAEAFDGWTGRLKLQVAGPWTLAASVWLPRGERVLADEGAARDLVDSLAEGVRLHLADVHRLVPGAELVLQVDEPSLPAALAGRLPTASGYGTVRALDAQVALDGLRAVLTAAGAGASVVHCCAPGIPLPLLGRTGAAVATDTSLLTAADWETVAVAVEEGATFYAGCVPTTGRAPRVKELADGLVSRWRELGMPSASLGGLVVTPACGLAGLTPQVARDVHRTCLETASELAARAVE